MLKITSPMTPTPRKVTVKVTNGTDQLNAVVTYDEGSTTPPTFINRYSTMLPEAGGAGLTMTYLAGASLLCFAATWMHARRHRDLDRGDRHGWLSRSLLAVATIIMVAILSFAIAPGAARAADTGAITVDGTVATRYDAYQLFSATVVDDDDAGQKIATDVTWANGAVRQAVLPVLHDAGLEERFGIDGASGSRMDECRRAYDDRADGKTCSRDLQCRRNFRGP